MNRSGFVVAVGLIKKVYSRYNQSLGKEYLASSRTNHPQLWHSQEGQPKEKSG